MTRSDLHFKMITLAAMLLTGKRTKVGILVRKLQQLPRLGDIVQGITGIWRIFRIKSYLEEYVELMTELWGILPSSDLREGDEPTRGAVKNGIMEV